ncbi:acyltransferase family protein [Amantichitinum ursilacus]|uniref:O-acetyltransferase OatA n=1 Tax=Amantichitinum ursilacus TaxID=857265 RepID=A0A0N1JRH2_9NEIS|nr:acyltransferase family protein [Amantichitinum ursilacus]KPC49558.1 O-acetyltransferase OatA [Amantichitinum ursilacus]
MNPGRKAHIAAIDGLRAVAVLAIILFHIQAAWLPGGFIGVDIFYVISGFVVAKSVASAPTDGLLSYFQWFYRRRLLRIVPALAVFIMLMSLLSTLFIPPYSRFIEVTGISALFGLSNFVLMWTSGDYFAAASSFNPFTHTWSLAVEEQYYLLFPFFSYLILISPKTSPQRRRHWLWGLGLVTLASMVFCAWLTPRNGTVAFYMLPTRFWELGAGFFAYVLCKNPETRTGHMLQRLNQHGVFSLLALVTLGVGLWIANERLFPWPWALLPCVATTVLVIGTVYGGDNLVNRVLANPLFTAIGKISYSLYLWHWGIIVLMRWTTGIDTPALQALSMLLMTVLAIASYVLVEKPLRFNPWLGQRGYRQFYAVVASALVVLAAFSGTLYLSKPEIGLFAARDEQVWAANAYAPFQAGDCTAPKEFSHWGPGMIIAFNATDCAQEKPQHVFIVGDSHASAYERMAQRLAAKDGYQVQIVTMGGCKLIVYLETQSLPGCPQFRVQALDRIKAQARPGDYVLLAGLYTARYRDIWSETSLPTDKIDLTIKPEDHVSAARAEALLQPLVDNGVHVILEAPKPVAQVAQFRCADWFNRINSYCQSATETTRNEMLLRRSRAEAYLSEVAANAGASLWDPFDALCPGAVCKGYVDGKPVFADTDHLSAFGNDLLYPGFKRAMQGGSATASTRPHALDDRAARPLNTSAAPGSTG